MLAEKTDHHPLPTLRQSGHLLRAWETRGKKYRIELYTEGGLYYVDEMTNGSLSASWNHYPDLQTIQTRLDGYLADSAKIDGINYKEVSISQSLF